MYYNFGYGSGFCHECPHFKRECWNKKALKKITGVDGEGNAVYELESFLACGLIDKPYPPDEIPGQLMMKMGRVALDG
jgi:hypothetical protein